jgi:hypothetical protein
VFYLQFDKEEFYRGAHNWRRGYFDYERDGFGPVARTVCELLHPLGMSFPAIDRLGVVALRRAHAALPDQSYSACETVFTAAGGSAAVLGVDGRRHSLTDLQRSGSV